MSLTKWQEALTIIATIEEWPEGRCRAAAFLLRYGVEQLGTYKPHYHCERGAPLPRMVKNFNRDSSDFITSDVLMIAVAKEAIDNP